MKNFYRCVFVAGLAIYSTGCTNVFGKDGFLQQHQTEYLRSHSSPPIQVPAGLSTANVHEDYPVPNANAPTPKLPTSIAPPNSLAAQVDQGTLSSKALKQREAMLEKAATIEATNDGTSEQPYSGFKNDTLIISQSATPVWPVIEDAITKAGYKIVVKNPSTQTFYILDASSTNGNITKQTPIYQIHLRNTPLGTEVSVSDNRGVRANLTDANRILDSIYNGLPKKSPRKSADNSTVTQQGVTPNSNPTSNVGRMINSLLH